jgi:uncharacterized protein (DUF302 family)
MGTDGQGYAGLTVFAHFDHAAGAAAVELSLRPTDLLIFGNARCGTPLMQSDQTIGIDLPLKSWSAGYQRHHLALIQRSKMACEAAWSER